MKKARHLDGIPTRLKTIKRSSAIIEANSDTQRVYQPV